VVTAEAKRLKQEETEKARAQAAEEAKAARAAAKNTKRKLKAEERKINIKKAKVEQKAEEAQIAIAEAAAAAEVAARIKLDEDTTILEEKARHAMLKAKEGKRKLAEQAEEATQETKKFAQVFEEHDSLDQAKEEVQRLSVRLVRSDGIAMG
jgi:colicin import membrane protein